MLGKGSKLYSIFNNKCPRCHEGDFFEYGSLFKLKKLLKLNSPCPNCGLNYMMEPSFFYGAMYVNYALTVGLAIITFLIAHLGVGLGLLNSFIAIVITIVLLTPLTMRLSRLIWINIFVKYNKDA
ncbi:DUF983 domain-containing protein [Urechidicola sp. KH5]